MINVIVFSEAHKESLRHTQPPMKWIIRALLEKGGLNVKLTIHLYVGLKTRRVVVYPLACIPSFRPCV
jgi:hypothetical protein